MRITKDLSKEIAEKLLSGKREAIDSQKEDMQKIAYKYTIASIRIDVLKAYEKFPDYFEKAAYAGILCKDISEDAIEIKLPKEVPSTGAWKVYSYVTQEEYKRLEAMERELENLESQLRESKSIIANTIFGLRTALQVQKHFPEAYEFLPKEESGKTLPMLNLDQVRALIK